ncbi:MAG: hypothetical protein HY784_01895 [Chloroflexi bacterium]|nr:hypothetical protein [Chloroflexota bacterium]
MVTVIAFLRAVRRRSALSDILVAAGVAAIINEICRWAMILVLVAMGWLFALFTVTLKANQVVAGVALNMLASGLTLFLSQVFFDRRRFRGWRGPWRRCRRLLARRSAGDRQRRFFGGRHQVDVAIEIAVPELPAQKLRLDPRPHHAIFKGR